MNAHCYATKICLGLLIAALAIGCGQVVDSGDVDATVAVCGNGVLEPGEQCDDGNQNDDDACTNSCTPNACVGQIDECGVCNGDNRDRDCEGVCFGDATEDMCGVCDADPANDCVQDCLGDWGGDAYEDPCGTCDTDPTNDCTTSYVANSGWSCAIGVACQDIYQFEIEAGQDLAIDVTGVTGNSVTRLAVFGPGISGGNNLLTGGPDDRLCVGQDQDDTAAIVAAIDGVYQVAVGRDWGQSAGASGTYMLRVVSQGVFISRGQTSDDVGSTVGEVCGMRRTGAWTCNSGVSCQDVYEVNLIAGSSVTISMTGISGSSVPRLALFGPGVPLSGVNLLTGSNNDRECVGQNVNDFVADHPIFNSGVYRVAAGRDWGSSAGTSGGYTLTVDANRGASFVAQITEDTPSEAAGSVCQ